MADLTPDDIAAELQRRGLSTATPAAPAQTVQAAPTDLTTDDIANQLQQRGLQVPAALPAGQTIPTASVTSQSNSQSQAPVSQMGRFKQVTSNAQDLPSYERFVKGLQDPVDAAAQMLTRALPTGVVNAVNSATSAVNNAPVIGPITKALGMVPATNQDINQTITKSNQQYDTQRKAAGGQGFDAYRLLGNIAVNAPLAYVAPNPASLTGAVASGAATGAAGGALTPVNNSQPGDDFWQQKLKQLGMGALTGAATAGVSKGIQKTFQPPNVSPDVQLLMSKGVTPTPGQILGPTASSFEEKLSSIPGLGDVIKAGQRRAIGQFNQAAYNEALAPIGATSTQAAGRTGVAEVKQTLGAAYDNILPKLTFLPDQQFAADMHSIAQTADALPPIEKDQFLSLVQNKVAPRFATNPNQPMQQAAISGDDFKNLENELGSRAKKWMGDPSSDKQDLGQAVNDMLGAFRQGLVRSNPQAAPILQAINKGYANYARVRTAAASLGAPEGVFTPAQLQNAVKAGDKSAGKGNFATGSALMQDLSEAGKNVLSQKIPDSGTAGRYLTALAAGGVLGHVSPFALGGGLLASSAYTSIGQKMMAGLLAGQRPQALRALATGIGKATPALGQSAVLGLLSRAAGG